LEELPFGLFSPARKLKSLGVVGELDGSFSIANRKGYPRGIPKPTGTFRIIEGGRIPSFYEFSYFNKYGYS